MESTDFQQEHHHHQEQQQQEHHCSVYYSTSDPAELQQQNSSYGVSSTALQNQFLHRPNPSNIITLTNQQRAGHGTADREEDTCASSGRLTTCMDDSSTFYQSPTIFHNTAGIAHQQANKMRIPTESYNLASPNVLSLSNYLNSIDPNDEGGSLSYSNWLPPLGILGSGSGANMEALSVSSARHNEFGTHVLPAVSNSTTGLSGLLSSCLPPVSNPSLMSSFLGLNSPAGCGEFPSLGFGDRQCSGQTMSLRSGCSSSNRLNKALSATLERNNNNGSSSSSSSSSVTGVKRPATSGNNYSKTTTTVKGTTSSKKSSAGSKSSGPPFKVRKEKLGDRIAALHQLVSPFGKTDTASVLTEAIGYIQFLQDQIHTLCMPTVKPPLHSSSSSSRMTHVVSSEHDQDARNQRGKLITAPDLRSRGLCMVPISWTSFLALDQLDAINNNHLHHHHFF